MEILGLNKDCFWNIIADMKPKEINSFARISKRMRNLVIDGSLWCWLKNDKGWDLEEILTDACCKEYTDIVRGLINSKIVHLEYINIWGSTPFIYACYYNKTNEIMKLLIDAGVDLECRDSMGNTAIHLACASGLTDKVKLLIDEGADLDFPNGQGMRAIHLACENNFGKLVRMLIDAGADLNCKDFSGKRPIDVAKEYGNTQIFEMLKEAMKSNK